ncbi:hypothetical protein TELCIR_18287, partial [Teladorsagia circumcincta]
MFAHICVAAVVGLAFAADIQHETKNAVNEVTTTKNSTRDDMRMSTQSSTRGGGSTMTWASSRRLVITNDVPQIVVGSSPRSHDRTGSTFTAPSYSMRGGTSQPSCRGGFQPSRGAPASGYAPRGGSTIQRG